MKENPIHSLGRSLTRLGLASTIGVYKYKVVPFNAFQLILCLKKPEDQSSETHKAKGSEIPAGRMTCVRREAARISVLGELLHLI